VKDGEIFVDMTINGGGHSSAICPLLGESGRLIGIDQDSGALKRSEKKLSGCKAKIILVESNFRHLDDILTKEGVEKVDKVLFDLGLSSNELELSGRGFSFKRDEPLLMTFAADPSQVRFTAKSIVNEWDEDNIRIILESYGDERFAKSIAKKIVLMRSMKPFETTFELVEAICAAVPAWYRNGKTNCATKSFQALRIAVNDEMQSTEEGLKSAWKRLSPAGRIAVISFHSLEDRVVKRFFKEKANEGEGILITKKPIVPSMEEVRRNPRSRSAKLRIIEKTKN
jgi:16S rRNA (cytosine1402-N4)-methyltransferase